MPVIRSPRAGDAAQLAALLGQLGYPTAEREIPSRLAAFATQANAAAWVAELDGQVRALATAHVITSVHKAEVVAMLTVLVVDETVRGSGLGRALVHEAERWAVERGASAISLTSALRRVDAHEFYRRLGYDHTGVRLAKSLR